jgi:hypothetical protein
VPKICAKMNLSSFKVDCLRCFVIERVANTDTLTKRN